MNGSQVTFLPTLAAMLSQYYPELITQPTKTIDSAGCDLCFNRTYDFIIVGAGSAGSVLANRLSENPNWNILLIEAGGDENYMTNIPALFLQTFGTRLGWNYTTTFQEHACIIQAGRCDYHSGHVLGGSSSINAMIFYRTPTSDYDEWEKMGNPGWGNEDVLPYFLKMENMTISELAIDKKYHSTKGPISVGYSIYRPQIIHDILHAGNEYGLETVDYNGKQRNLGIGYTQKSVKGPIRCSTNKGYLEPIRSRKNLYIFKNTLVTKILFNEDSPRRAIGAKCRTNEHEYDVYATKEVIISAGAINSPKLLMLSGVGPRKHLEELDIPVILDLPGVGANLVDHVIFPVIYDVNKTEKLYQKVFTYKSAVEYARYSRGPLTTNVLDVFIAMNRKNSTTVPPDVLYFAGFGRNYLSIDTVNTCYLTFLVSIVNINSTGSVRLASNDFRVQPLIDPTYFSNSADLDLAMWSLRSIFNIVKMPSLAKYSPKWRPSVAPYCNRFPYLSDEHLRCYIMYTSGAHYHSIGTARMGPKSNSNTVVDSTLNLHGINNLRVVDASIMPRIPRGNTNIPTIMVAEKAADLIKRDYK